MTLLEIAPEIGAVSGGLGALISTGTIIKLLTDKATMKQEIKGLKEKMIEVTSSKKALKNELEKKIEAADKSLKEDVDKKDQILHARIDRVRDDNIKSYEKLENKITDVEKKMDTHTQQILEAINSKK